MSSVACCKVPDMSLILLQSEYGDLYKITLAYDGDTVTELRVKYFDTIPPCTSICVLKTGFLFAASEFGNHALYQFLVSLTLAPSCALLLCLKAGSSAAGPVGLRALLPRACPLLLLHRTSMP